jgi:hypothetical protein
MDPESVWERRRAEVRTQQKEMYEADR